jgi:uncharacterized membrane protein
MTRIEHRVTVNRTPGVVYNQWTQTEDFPKFMQGVKSVHQKDATHQEWCAEVAGQEIRWESEIIEQVPDRKIVWRSVSGAKHGGMVEFTSVEGNKTCVHLIMEYEPEGLLEHIGQATGLTEQRVQEDLQRFKEFIESRGAPTGAWRGEVHHASVERG